MKELLVDTFEREPKHPYGQFIRSNTTHLIIGTYPTSAHKRFPFFYSGESNLFWKILATVYQEKFIYNDGLKAKQIREEFLERHRIGLIDMIDECYRRNNSAKDSNLYPIMLTKILSVLRQYQSIRNLIFTSRSPAVSALGLFNIYIYQNGFQMIEPQTLKNGLKVGIFDLEGKRYKVWVPYSPSQNSKISKKLGVKGLSEMYKECLID